MNNFIFILMLIFACICVSCDLNYKKSNKTFSQGKKAESAHIHYKEIQGLWMKQCNGEAGHLSILDSFSAVMEVNSNQIVIKLKLDSSEIVENSLFIKLSKPLDLGSGGMRLDWDNFSRDSIIAKIKFNNESTAQSFWYGFYDNNQNKRVWVEEPDLLHDDYNRSSISIKKCSFPLPQD